MLVEHAQLHAGSHQALHARRDVFFSEQSFTDGGQDVQIDRAAVQVAAVLDGQRGRFRRGIRDLVVQMEIADCAAVGDKVSLKSPVAAQNFGQQIVGAGGLAIDAVVSAHDAFDLRFLDQCLKGGKIGIVEILLGNHRVKFVAQGFRAGMHGKMLGAGGRLEILRVVAL